MPTHVPAARILVVTDQDETARSLSRAISADGHEPLLALSGTEARRLLAAGRPDLILLDTMLRDVGGIELCREIKSNRDTMRVPVVLLTALAADESRARGIQAGCDEFLARPIHAEELRMRVRALLKWQAARRALEAAREVAPAAAGAPAWPAALARHLPAPLLDAALASNAEALAATHNHEAVAVAVHLRGLDHMAELRVPAEVLHVISRLHELLYGVAHAHGAAVFDGRGTPLLVFGIAMPLPHAACVALGAARDVVLQGQPLIEAWNALYGVRLGLGVAVSQGRVLAGRGGAPEQPEYLVLGPVLDQAQTLARRADDQDVVCDAALQAVAAVQPQWLADGQPLDEAEPAASAWRWRVVPEVPPIRVLIIDDAPDVRTLLSKFIRVDWPQAMITEYDPLASGRPGPDFDWTAYDVVLLDYMLGTDDDGLDWLRAFRQVPQMPPILFLTGGGNEAVAAKAIKLGAVDYLTKQDLSRRRLTQALKEALDEAAASAALMRRAEPEKTGITSAVPVVPAQAGPAPVAIAGYHIIRKLGEGGMASVYLADHLESGERRVLKLLDTRLSADSDFLDRFIHEYGVISRVSSPHVIRIYDQGFTADHAYISMEFLGGGDLKARIVRGLPVDEAMRIFRELLQALKAVHDAGVVHRDLKPHNIMFRDDGSVVLVDFGIAKAVDGAHGLTQTGTVIGTPLYMSPEQAQGLEIDYRADLYSAGVILFEMLTGRLPYESDTIVGLIHQHCQAPLPQLPKELSDYQILITRLMAKNPDDRYQSAHALLPGGV